MYSSHEGRKPSQNTHTEYNKQAQHPLTAGSVNFTPLVIKYPDCDVIYSGGCRTDEMTLFCFVPSVQTLLLRRHFRKNINLIMA